ncbi:Rne/Rng family ribonuclease [bacterium]|nr:Rne/Rng family ribonuclease [bacterium]
MPINRILINREENEVRVAFLDNQELVELHIEKSDDQTIVNNIYRGRVQDVVPGLQAAFIDVGLERNMFLHFMDIRPESLVLGAADQRAALKAASVEPVAGRIERKGRRPRQDPRAPQADSPVKRGDELVIQVVKDEIGGKAPRVTTNLSLAGRYLVLLPFPSQEGGVSRKIAQGQDRHRLKKLLSSIRDDDHSFIIRTAGSDQPEEAIIKDAENLERTWDNILLRYKEIKGPGIVHNDHNLLSRLIRDAFPADFEEIVCDKREDALEVRRQLQDLMPHLANRIKVFDGTYENIFAYYGVDKMIEKATVRKVWLKSGGYLIIDENEALTAIDVNTGRFTGKKDQEKTSLRTNLEACEAVAEQIRVRDIGGIIVVDFIDMLSRSHQEKVSEELKRFLKHDRARTAVSKIGDFGLCVLTRKRQRMSLQNTVFDECPYCKGTGFVLSADEVFRRLKYQILGNLKSDPLAAAFAICAHPHFIDVMTRRYRVFIEQIKRQYNIELAYRADPDFHMDDFTVTTLKKPLNAAPRIAARMIDATDLARRRDAERYEDADLEDLRGGATTEAHAEFEDVETGTSEVLGDLPADSTEQTELFADDVEELKGLIPFADVLGEIAEVDPTEELPGAGDVDGKKRRRRRESSAERRERRRRRLALEAQQAAAGDAVPPGKAALTPAEPLPPAVLPAMDGEEEDDDSEEIPMVGGAQPSEGAEGDARRKTRRGRRGGRNRRRRQEERQQAEAAATSGPKAPAPVEQPKPKEMPKLKLAPAAKDPLAELLGGVLEELDKSVEQLKADPEALAQAAAEAARAGAARAASRKERRRVVRVPGEETEHVLPIPGQDEEAEEIQEVVSATPEPAEVPKPAAPSKPRRSGNRSGSRKVVEAPVVADKQAKPDERRRKPKPQAKPEAPAAAPAPVAKETAKPKAPAKKASKPAAKPVAAPKPEAVKAPAAKAPKAKTQAKSSNRKPAAKKAKEGNES